jgi:hypothetical protein
MFIREQRHSPILVRAYGDHCIGTARGGIVKKGPRRWDWGIVLDVGRARGSRVEQDGLFVVMNEAVV